MTTEEMRKRCHEAISRMRPYRLNQAAHQLGVLGPVRHTAHEPEHPHSDDAGGPWQPKEAGHE